MSQHEMDQCWETLAAKIEAEVLESTRLRTAKGSFQMQKRSVGMEAGAQTQERQNNKMGGRLVDKNLRFVQKIQLAVAAKQAG